ncbi:PfkB family carbohydrate kinase [Terrimonas pollutisoli]|uniref:PfkB family carbohydrate kinase n=1 Tax=Terrimonas pollutisoli TaxID=3034147 RepID=UPI0023EE21D1|nr:PfkB family carbohydrate kinase [Terrimonas sp. H1YJ31]
MSRPVICIGASFVDELFHLTEELIPATTNKATVTKTAGGVSRNIAHQLALLDVPVQLISVFGNDSDGDWLKGVCTNAGIKLDASITANGLSGKYTGILTPDGSLFAAFLSNPAEHLITPQHLAQHKDLLSTASWLLADTNITLETISWLIAFSNQTGIPLVIEPVSVPPAKKLKYIDINGLYLITPNEDELPALCSEDACTTEKQIQELLSKGVQHIWLHNGKNGSAFYSKENCIQLHASIVDVVDSTGAGDGSLSGYILGKMLGKEDMDCLKLAHTLAAEILQINGAVATHLNQQRLLSLLSKHYPVK